MSKPAPTRSVVKYHGAKAIKNRSTAPATGQPTGLNAAPALGGSPTGNGKSPAAMVRSSNLWRDNYNPLRALTIARLTAIFEAAERGAYAELQLTLRKAEKRFPVLKGFIEKLLSSIEELEWDVKVMAELPAGATPAMAEAQRKFLRGRYDLLKNLTNTFGQLALADIRGYAVLQKHRYADGGPNDGAVSELYWLEPWCWCRDGFYGDFYYNADSRIGVGLGSCSNILGEANRIGGDSLPRAEFVVREVDSPLYEIALIAMVNWLMARKDYAAFVEIFGLPNSVVIMPPNITPGKEADYQAAAEKVADGVSGALPNGSDVKFPGAGAGKEDPFEKFCEAQDKDVVLAATGGTLTMIAMPTGLGKGASEEHDSAWQKIAITKARRVNETLQRDFDLPELAAEFPGQPVCVYFELAVKNHEDVNLVADTVVKFEGVGLQTDAAEISERSGYKLTRVALAPANDPAAKADEHIDARELSAAVKNRQPQMDTDETQIKVAQIGNADEIGQTLHEMILPLLKRLEAIAQVDDVAIQQHMLEKLLKDFPSIANAISADESLAKKLSPVLANGLIAGLTAENPKSTKISNRAGKILNGGEGSGRYPAGSGGKVYRETRVPIHPEAARRLGLKSQSVFADHAALAAKHPELFHNSVEAKEYVEHVMAHPTHIVPGNEPDHQQIIRRESENKSVALEVELKGGKYRVKSAHTLRDSQFEERVKAAGPGATLGVSRVNPKIQNSETPSRSLGTPLDVPPAVIQRILQNMEIVNP